MDSAISFRDLSTKYLSWCKKHKAPRTHEWYEGHLLNFIEFLGSRADDPAVSMKPYQVVEWVDSEPTWGPTYKGSGIVAVKRVFNWAEEMGYMDSSPIKKIKKPPAGRRDNHMKPENYEAMLARLSMSDPFRDLFLFVWNSGCRPQEVRHIEARHVNLAGECITFPALESKGKRYPRTIYLYGEALEIINRLTAKHPEGKIFRNTRGAEWSKFAVCNRMYRLSRAVGKPFAMYDARHGFATRKLIQGHDHLTIAAIMGHRDGSMLAKVYSHVDKDTAHLKKALID